MDPVEARFREMAKCILSASDPELSWFMFGVTYLFQHVNRALASLGEGDEEEVMLTARELLRAAMVSDRETIAKNLLRCAESGEGVHLKITTDQISALAELVNSWRKK